MEEKVREEGKQRRKENVDDCGRKGRTGKKRMHRKI